MSSLLITKALSLSIWAASYILARYLARGPFCAAASDVRLVLATVIALNLVVCWTPSKIVPSNIFWILVGVLIVFLTLLPSTVSKEVLSTS